MFNRIPSFIKIVLVQFLINKPVSLLVLNMSMIYVVCMIILFYMMNMCITYLFAFPNSSF